MAIPVNEGNAVTNVTSNTTSASINLPSSVAADDLILFICAFDGSVSNLGNSGGLTMNEITLEDQGANTYICGWSRASGGETTQTITWTGSQQCRVMTLRISGVDSTGDPIDQIGAGTSQSSATTQIVFGVNSSEADTLAIAAVCVDRNRVDSGDVLTTANGFSDVGTSGSSGGSNGAGLCVADKGLASSGFSSNPTFGTWASDSTASRMFNVFSTIPTVTEVVHASPVNISVII